MENKKKKLYTSLGVSALVLFILAISYAYFVRSNSQTSTNQITTLNCLSTTITDVTGAINLVNEYPVSDNNGMLKTPYTFTVTNNCDQSIKIDLGLESLSTNTLNSDYVKASLNNSGETSNRGVILTSLDEGTAVNGGTNYLLTTDTLAGNASKTFDLRIWLDYDTTMEQGSNKTYSGKIVVTQSIGFDPNANTIPNSDSSNANAPILADNMIPVYYDITNDTWKKADSNNPTGDNNWYDYNTQKWANAVTVTSATRSTYNNATAGTSIPMSDILGMWVWIPRFEYRTDNLGENYADGTLEIPGELSVNFISGTSTTNTTNYLIHPAFRSGLNYKHANSYDLGGWDKELTGFWYGKFETGYATNVTSAVSALTSGVLVKPDVYGLKYITVSNAFITSQNVQDEHGIGSQIETHMSKNDEWSAVAYLTQSKYGKYGNADYTDTNNEVFVNNAYLETGYVYNTGRSAGTYSSGTNSGKRQYGMFEYNDCPASADTSTACPLSSRQTYATRGTGASTTGNIYGVYDMAGGLQENVMAVREHDAVSIYSGNNYGSSGFTGYIYSNSSFTMQTGVEVPEQKYYNRYTSENFTTSCNGIACVGQGNIELGAYFSSTITGWYRDVIDKPTYSSCWLARGKTPLETHTVAVGIYSATVTNGGADYLSGFRIAAV